MAKNKTAQCRSVTVFLRWIPMITFVSRGPLTPGEFEEIQDTFPSVRYAGPSMRDGQEVYTQGTVVFEDDVPAVAASKVCSRIAQMVQEFNNKKGQRYGHPY